MKSIGLALVGNPWPEPDYDTRSHDDNSGVHLFLALVLAAFIAWLRKRNEENAPKWIGLGVLGCASIGAYNAPPGEGVVLFVIGVIGGSFGAYFLWLISGFFMGDGQ